jgi:hypothetical protein
MRPYKYTDKLLYALAIGNILIIIPSIWGVWLGLSIFWATEGDGNQLLITILMSASQWLIILVFTAWAFFKRWRLVLLLYVPYLSTMIPVYISALIQAWEQNDGWNFLNSRISGYSYVTLWLLSLIVLIVMLIETDYGSLQNKWHRWRSQM